MTIKRIIQLLAAGAALHAGLAAAHAEDQKTLKIGVLKMGALTNVWVAEREGIFKKNGIDAKLVEFKNGGDAVIAQQSGDVDIVLSIPGTAFTAIDHGFDLTAIFQNETSTPTVPNSNSLQVRVDSPIKSVKDLAGKKIAISGLHSQSTVSVQRILKDNGVPLDSVQFIELPNSAGVNALKSKQVDAASVPDPFTTQLLVSGVGRAIAWVAKDSVAEQPLGVWFTKRKFVKDHADLVNGFAKSLKESIDYMLADPDRARRDIAAYTGLDMSLVKDMPMIGWNYTVDPAKWQAVVDMMAEFKEIKPGTKAQDYMSTALNPYVEKN